MELGKTFDGRCLLTAMGFMHAARSTFLPAALQARAKELRLELLNSERLKAHFEDHPGKPYAFCQVWMWSTLQMAGCTMLTCLLAAWLSSTFAASMTACLASISIMQRCGGRVRGLDIHFTCLQATLLC